MIVRPLLRQLVRKAGTAEVTTRDQPGALELRERAIDRGRARSRRRVDGATEQVFGSQVRARSGSAQQPVHDDASAGCLESCGLEVSNVRRLRSELHNCVHARSGITSDLLQKRHHS